LRANNILLSPLSSNTMAAQSACLCENCQRVFFQPPSQVRRGRGRFCSRKCMNAKRSDNAYFSFQLKLAALEHILHRIVLTRATAVQGEKAKSLLTAEFHVRSQISKLKRKSPYLYNRCNRYRKLKLASRTVAWAIRRRELTKKPCEICGKPRTQAHHEDYSKLLEVRWLCRKHHREADEIRRHRERAPFKQPSPKLEE
jgi:hypothetical protein